MSATDQRKSDASSNRTATFAERLERGEILRFAPGEVSLPDEAAQEFLREGLASSMNRKNVSYHPEGDYVTGVSDHAAAKRALDVLRTRAKTVSDFLAPKLPEYASDWRECKVNARPIQERGREISKHSSNELVHVDAFPSGPTYGARPLRFFTNINTSEPRVWKSAGLFGELYPRFAKAAGLAGDGTENLSSGLASRAAKSTLSLLASLGVEKARLIGTSPYDRAMKSLHDALKDDDAFQTTHEFEQFEFEPGASWCCFTDLVSHAVVSGQHVLVNTYYVPLESCLQPELTPFNVMNRASR